MHNTEAETELMKKIRMLLSGGFSKEHLVETLNSQNTVFKEAISRSEIFPYAMMSDQTLSILSSFRDSVNSQVYEIVLMSGGHPQALSLMRQKEESFKELNEIITVLEVIVPSFKSLYERIYSHIQLEVLPDESLGGERLFLRNGKIVVPATIKDSSGYFIFGVTYGKCNDCNKEHIHIDQLTERAIPSLDSALRDIDRTLLQTVAVARNTESYPLEATVIPILKLKYHKGLEGK